MCEECHGRRILALIQEEALKDAGPDPLRIAAGWMKIPFLPMLGCEHALIAAGAFLASLRSEGTVAVSDGLVLEALERTRRQAIGAFCGLTGVCGIAIALGAAFSVVLQAACPRDRETAMTMRVVARVTDAIASQTGPCCCKNFVFTGLSVAVGLAKEYWESNLPLDFSWTACQESERHPHGCRKAKCPYYAIRK